jgi:hypothetical protein
LFATFFTLTRRPEDKVFFSSKKEDAMPHDLSSVITKTEMQHKVDEICNGPLRQQFLAALKNPREDWINFLEENGLSRVSTSYLRTGWFNETGFWERYHPIEPIIRQSLVTALELAIEHNLPIDSYLISGGDQFEVVITYSASQVTRIVLTPPNPPVFRFLNRDFQYLL